MFEYDYEKFFLDRLLALRVKKGVSAREMSLALGQSENYINYIDNEHGFPSMRVFFAICVYLGVSPKEFFDDGNADPTYLRDLIENLKGLNAKDMELVSDLVKRLKNQP